MTRPGTMTLATDGRDRVLAFNMHRSENHGHGPITGAIARARLAVGEASDKHERRRRERQIRRGRNPDEPGEPPFLVRLADHWWNRVITAVYSGNLSDQTEQYAAHSGGRDYVWNTIGMATWGFLFPMLTIVATWFSGVEHAGMFSMAFTVGSVLMWMGNYGVRTYQVSDVDEGHSFYDYLICRVVTCLAMVVAGMVFCRVRGYVEPMLSISLGVFGFRVVDAMADVFEGRLQQCDKLYLAGISQTIRSVAGALFFSAVILVTRNIGFASVAMLVGGVASLVLVTVPLGFLETEPPRRATFVEVREIFRECLPLFSALFLYSLIDCVPKLVMENSLSYDNQLYFNAMYFPTHSIIMMAGILYKPQLVRLANIWAQPDQRRRFSLIVFAMIALIAGISVAVGAFILWLGIPIMNFMYGLDFEPYTALFLVMVGAGFLGAAIDFLYQIITVLRAQGAVTRIYAIAFALSILVSELLVNFAQLSGAVVASCVSMAVLFALLLTEYFAIRKRG